MRVALVHHWLVRMRGGEKVLAALADLFPEADVFTLFHAPAGISDQLNKRRIKVSWLNRIPCAARIYPYLLPLYPMAVSSIDLTGYDLVITSDSSLMKGVKVPEGAVHICYCHSPPRYLWGMGDLYSGQKGLLGREVMRYIFYRLRGWDKRASRKVDYFIANSMNVAGRIARCYGRDSVVVYPPVDEKTFKVDPVEGGFYLIVGHLVPYKRVDIAVRAFTEGERRLVVIGEGPELLRLKRMAGPFIEFKGWLDDDEVMRHMTSCRAVIFPGEEDFGIVPVEAHFAGKPVIAYGRGGALETVKEGETGVFFEDQDPASLMKAVERFESMEDTFFREAIRRSAQRFSPEAFSSGILHCIERALA